MINLNHKNLVVWKKSIELIKEIYRITESFPKSEVYGITNQLRRASVSIASNIAEGASRKSTIERKRFYQISRSSLVEVDTQLEISIALNFLYMEKLGEVKKLMNEVFAMLTTMINKTL
ncbi:MAG: four helix bundle protein [Ignavibacteria bacterium]